jgi:Ca-activated chloride channel family protein
MVLRGHGPGGCGRLVIDVSDSMNMENRLGAVTEALRAPVESLRPTDHVGIVVYGSQARVVLEPTAVDEQETILAAFARPVPGGWVPSGGPGRAY